MCKRAREKSLGPRRFLLLFFSPREKSAVRVDDRIGKNTPLFVTRPSFAALDPRLAKKKHSYNQVSSVAAIHGNHGTCMELCGAQWNAVEQARSISERRGDFFSLPLLPRGTIPFSDREMPFNSIQFSQWEKLGGE